MVPLRESPPVRSILLMKRLGHNSLGRFVLSMDEKLKRLKEASGSDEVISPLSPPSRHRNGSWLGLKLEGR